MQRLSHRAPSVKTGGSAQNIPSAAFASSDIISGFQAGRRTISGLTSPIPGTGARKARIWSSISGPIGQPIVVSVYWMSTSPVSATST
jgi:hypothetical protein